MTATTSRSTYDLRSEDSGIASARRVMTRVAHAAAIRGERLISACRLLFCIVVLARFLVIGRDAPWPALALNVSAIVAAILFSAWMLRKIAKRTVSERMLTASVALDALVCFLSLLQTVLWPHIAHYDGLLARPDASAILVMILCAGFRLSPTLAAFGSGMNALCLTVLLSVEHRRHGPNLAYDSADIVFFSLIVVSMSVLALAIATQTRRLVESGALASMKVERTRRGLAHLVRDQHDAKNLLSAASLDAELFQRALAKLSFSELKPLQELARNLKDDLCSVNSYIKNFGERAFEEMAGLDELKPADAASALPAVIAALRTKFPSVTINATFNGLCAVHIAGGHSSLERILYNLVTNAIEGDGTHGATQIHIIARARKHKLTIRVTDNGPGFSPALLSAQVNSCLSTKPRGSGLGLHGVAHIIQTSNGHLRRGNTPQGGAFIELDLPKHAPHRGSKHRLPEGITSH